MQTAFHILSLVKELANTILGGTIVSTEFYKKERAAYIFIKKDKSTGAIGFVFHPAGFGTFCVPASKVKVETKEKPWPIFDMVGATITEIKQLGFDRIFQITIENDRTKRQLVFESIGPNGNIWLTDKDDIIQATLRKREYSPGARYQQPKLPDAVSPIDLSADKLQQSTKNQRFYSVRQFLQKQLFGVNKTIASELVKRSGLEDEDFRSLSENNFEQLSKNIRELTKLFESASVGYLYQIAGAIEVYPFKLSSQESQSEKFKTLSVAVQELTRRRQSIVEQASEEKTITNALKRTIKRLTKRIAKIETEIEKAEDYETYKKMAELIQINLNNIKKGTKEITFDDIYLDSSAKLTIKLDPALTPAKNAEKYFQKHRKAREGLEQMKRRFEISNLELENLLRIQSDLESNFERAKNQYQSELAEIMPKEGGVSETFQRLPYKEYELKSGVKIFVGRDGSDNDRTTFDFAKPYELWFHTQQCAGSHVVLKFPNKSFEPSRREIEETAAVAAYFSKARKDTLVPVLYTPRKYVRKPRKSKPGLVTVEREKSVMVAPAKPEG